VPIEVACPSCGKVLRVKESFAGKSGKCPQCGNVIHVPQAAGTSTPGQPLMTPHVVGVKVRGGVKKEEIPLRGTQMVGFIRPVIRKSRLARQASLGLVLAIIGLLLVLVPTVPTPLKAGPGLGLVGGVIGALGAALAGWGLLNILQMAVRYHGKGVAITGLGLGVVAFVMGLMVFTGKGGLAEAGANLAAKAANLTTLKAKVDVSKCTEQLQEAHKVLMSYVSKTSNFPMNLTDLVPRYVADMRPLACPITGDGTTLYEYHRGLTTKSAPDTPLLYDAKGNHEGGRNVLLLSGQVVWMSEEQLQAVLKGPEAAPTGRPAQPPAPSEGTLQPEKPAAPSEAAGQPEKPAAPSEAAGQPEKPAAPSEETGQPEKPAAPSEETGQPEKPAATESQ